MKHYEFMVLLHPDQTEQIEGIKEHYRKLLTASGNKIHRMESIGKRKLAYPIRKAQREFQKAYYLLMNVEIDAETLEKFYHELKYSEAVLRYLVIQKEEAITTPSPLMLESESSEPPKRFGFPSGDKQKRPFIPKAEG